MTASLLVGCMPGVYVGARLSSGAPGGIIRRALALVLLASGLKLIGVSTVALAWVLLGFAVVGSLVWMRVRSTHGLPPLARHERRAPSSPAGAEPRAEALVDEAGAAGEGVGTDFEG